MGHSIILFVYILTSLTAKGEQFMSKNVCVCKHVSQESIQKALDRGTSTMTGVRIATGAGAGACQGKRCKEKIQSMIKAKE